MKFHTLATAAVLFCAGAAHAGGFDVCDFESEFSLRIDDSRLIFERTGEAPRHIEMRQGRLIVDAKEAVLTKADRQRIADFESRVRVLVPEVKAIALEAVGVATEAVLQVATTFSANDTTAVLKRVDQLSDDLSRRIERSTDSAEWDAAEFESEVESLVQELIPAVVGDVTAIALKVALSGDESAARELETRAEQLEKAIEESVERRARALERRAERLCPDVAELDRIESALEYRLVGNQPLDLVRLDR